MIPGRIILDMPNPALDRNGASQPKAMLYFYPHNSAVLAEVWTDATLSTPLTNPVIADGAGRFVEVWADASVTYDARWTDLNDALIYTFSDIAPLTSGGAASDGSNINASAFRAALGLGSAAVEDADTSGHTLPFLDGDNAFSGANNFTGSLTLSGQNVGYLGFPPNAHNAAYSFVLTDRGQGHWHASSVGHVWTIPLAASMAVPTGPFSQGDAMYLRNIGSGVVTVTPASGVTLRIAGSGTIAASVALASFGSAILSCDATDVWCLSGVGLS